MRLLKSLSPLLTAMLVLALSSAWASAQGRVFPGGEEAFQAAQEDIPSDLSEDAKTFLEGLFTIEGRGAVDRELLADTEGLPAEVMPYLVEIVGREDARGLMMNHVRFDTPGIRAWGTLRELAEQYLQAYTDSAVPKLAEVLADESQAEYARVNAVYMLAWSDCDAARHALIAALKSDSLSVKCASARSLGATDNAFICNSLVEAYETTDDERLQLTILRAFTQLGRRASGAVPVTLAALEDERASIRSEAIKALASIGNRLAVMPICQRLTDENEYTRMYAAKALGDFEDARATSALIERLEADTFLSVRGAACSSLGAIRDRRAVPSLIVALGDENVGIRRGAAEALGNIGDVRAVMPLTVLLEDEDRGVVFRAADALGQLNDPRAIKPLVDMAVTVCGYDHDWSRTATKALKAIRHPDVVYILIDNLPNEWWPAKTAPLGLLEDLTGQSFQHGTAAQNWRGWKQQQLQAGSVQ